MRKVKCVHCGHEWVTRSTYRWVTCSSCGYKTPAVLERPRVVIPPDILRDLEEIARLTGARTTSSSLLRILREIVRRRLVRVRKNHERPGS